MWDLAVLRLDFRISSVTAFGIVLLPPVNRCSSQGLVRYVEKPGEGEGEARTSQAPCRAIRVVLAWYAHDRTLITARS